MVVGLVAHRKEYICQEGLLEVNCAQIHNQNLAAIVYKHTTYQGKATD